MTTLTVEVDFDDIVASASGDLTIAVQNAVLQKAKELAARANKTREIADLTEPIKALVAADKDDAEQIVAVLKELVNAVNDKLAQIALAHKISVYLDNGLYLNEYRGAYGDEPLWISSSYGC